MEKRLKLMIISFLIGISGSWVVTASQWYPASEMHADTTDAFHIWLPHLAEDKLHSNKSLEFSLEQYSAFLASIDELPLYNIFIGITLAIFALLLYRPIFKPLWLIRKFGDVGYITDGRSKGEVAEEIRKRKRIRAGNVPPVYPNGWFSLARSWDLKNGEVKHVQGLGQDFAVFRGEDGTPYAIDAYCPHLGANLGVVGKVKGDCIEFHGRTYRGSDGKCTDLAYSDQNVPDAVNTKAWACVERNYEICIWHHAEGEEPNWFPSEIDVLNTGKMKFHGYSEHFVNSHIEEIPENAADFAHFGHVHGPFVPAGRDLRYKFEWIWNWIEFVWDVNWYQDEDNKHIGVLKLNVAVAIFGYKLPYSGLAVTARQIGSGIVCVQAHHPIIGDICLMQTVIPVEPLVQKVTHTIFTTPLIIRPIAKILLWTEAFQFERDMMVWNYKTFQSKPILMKEEGVMGKHRRWYSQFYSENSPRYIARKDGFEW